MAEHIHTPCTPGLPLRRKSWGVSGGRLWKEAAYIRGHAADEKIPFEDQGKAEKAAPPTPSPQGACPVMHIPLYTQSRSHGIASNFLQCANC